MKIRRNILLLITLLAFFYACIEEYIPPLVEINSSRYLTVNGIIYNDDSLKSIVLSRAKNVWEADSQYEMVNNAQVTIIDDLGNRESFHQFGNGIYQSLFNPQHERSYQLHITDEYGNEYQSEQVKMEATSEIDSIYWRMNNNLTIEGKENQGIDILISTHDDLNKYSYYKWDWTETWEIRTIYRAAYKYNNGNILPTNEIPNICWCDNSTADIIIGNTESLLRNQIADKIIQVIPFTQNKVHIRYSIHVRQYALDKKAFKFWDDLQNTGETSGSLFDRQPFELKSNIMNINDTEERVMGYFDIYDVKKKRIFIDRKEIPIVRGIDGGYKHCYPETIRVYELEEYISRGFNLIQPIRFGPEIISWVVIEKDCSDCRTRGNENIPSFWE